MYHHVQEQNLGHHVKFLQSTEYTNCLTSLVCFFPYKHLSPEGGKHLSLSWPSFSGTLQQ